MPAPEGPVVTILREGPRRVIAAVNAAARAIGLRPGLPVAAAQASVPGLVIADATPDDDAEALVTLAAWCLRYAPVVQAEDRLIPDGGACSMRAGSTGSWSSNRASTGAITGTSSRRRPRSDCRSGPCSSTSAKGVMFIMIEDESGVANLVVWSAVFEAHRRIVLGAGMVAVPALR